MQACTIIAANYLPHARVLARTFRAEHREGKMNVLIVDEPDAATVYADEPFVALGPYELGLERAELHRMAMIYDVKELSTALKPFLLRRLLEDDDHCVYFDPDIQVFAPLDDIAELAREHAIVLTPHVTKPIPRDGRLPDDRMILQAGIYNLGFIAVGREALGFLEWWAERLARDCVVDVPRALFVDQRWIDFVPALFPHHVLRDPGCNVAYWNLFERDVIKTEHGFEVNGAPLRFFHFSGFDPHDPTVLSAHMGEIPRLRATDEPAIETLCREYGELLAEAGYTGRSEAGYGWDVLPNGVRADARFRRLYRATLLAAERRDGEVPPDPVDEPDELLAWLRRPGPDAGLPPLLAAIWDERPDLRAAFPDIRGVDRNRFLAWAASSSAETGIPPAALPPFEGAGRHSAVVEMRLRELTLRYGALGSLRPAWRSVMRARLALRRTRGLPAAPEEARVLRIARRPQRGFTIAGYFHAELGVGEAARRLLAGVDRAGISYSTVAYRRTVSRQDHALELRGEGRALYDVNVICVNADQLPVFAADIGSAFFRDRHTVGLWFWEVSYFPKELHAAFRHVDEVWAASEFVRVAIAAHTEKDVHVVPLPMLEPKAPELTRRELRLPERFVFLFTFDFMSVLERKNPLALIEAYTHAFGPEDGAYLLIKTINGERTPVELARLRRAAAGRRDVEVRNEYVSAEVRDGLTAACDCYVSLHRSEGFGLTMAEAMAFGKPVIATGYSGNMTFMDESNSILLPYELVPIPIGTEPYPPGVEWAAPDVATAAAEMRRLFEDRDAAKELGRRGREDVLERFSVDRCAEFVSARFDEIIASRSSAKLVRG